MPYQHREFIQCTDIALGSEAFKQLMQDFPVKQILFPKDISIAKEIWQIIQRSNINEIYPPLFDLVKKTADLRPHLVYLLHGFKENEQHYQLDTDRFLTLHWIAQLIASNYKNIQAIPVVNGLDLLRLNQDEKRAFITAQLEKKLPASETALFKIEVDEITVATTIIKLLIAIEAGWKDTTQDKTTKKTYSNNKRLIDQFIQKHPQFIQFQQVNSDNIVAFRAAIMRAFRSDAFVKKLLASVIDPVMFNGQSPLLTFHLIDNKWCFLILASSVLNIYLETSSGQKLPITMHWRYQPITPAKMKEAKLKFQRLGRLSHFGQETFPDIHAAPVLDCAEETRHDLYHYYILAFVPLAVHQMTNYMITLLEKETQQSISHNSWKLIDSEFNYSLNQKYTPTDHFKKILSRIFDHTMHQSHEWSIILTDLFVNPEKEVWKNIDSSSFINNKAHLVQIYQVTKSLSTAAMYLYLCHNYLAFLPSGTVSWKRDHHLYKNDISIYINDAPIRDIVFLYQLTTQTKQFGTFRKTIVVPGGRIHHMWHLVTTTGEYAVKILNSTRTSKTDLVRYKQTEIIATHFAPCGAISALPINNDVIFSHEEKHCMVYPWIEGKTPSNNRAYALKVGSALAHIHKTPMTYDPKLPSHTTYVNQDPGTLQWSFPKLTGDLKNALASSLTMITLIQNQAVVVKATPLSDQNDCVVSHRDLDATNALMQGETILLIDWELAGYIEPCTDFLLTALYTARTAPGVFDLNLFKAFISGYTEVKPIPNPAAWEKALLRVLDGWLQWLHFNLNRTCKEGDIGYIEAGKILKTITAVYGMKNQWDLTQYQQAASNAPNWDKTTSSDASKSQNAQHGQDLHPYAGQNALTNSV